MDRRGHPGWLWWVAAAGWTRERGEGEAHCRPAPGRWTGSGPLSAVLGRLEALALEKDEEFRQVRRADAAAGTPAAPLLRMPNFEVWTTAVADRQLRDLRGQT